MGNDIIKVAVLPIVDERLLVCRKKGLDFLVNLGGRIETINGMQESDEECATRETREEAGCGITNLRYFTIINAPRGDMPGNIEMRCYFGDLIGTPTINPNDSIYEFVWVDRNWGRAGHKIPPSMGILMPKLVSQGYL